MKYKVGDKVRIKSLDWYNQNKNSIGDINFGEVSFVESMCELLGVEAIILEVKRNGYIVSKDDHKWLWTDEMFEEDYESTLSKKSGIIMTGDDVIYNPCTDYADTLTVSIELIKSGMNPNDVANTAKSIIVKLKQD